MFPLRRSLEISLFSLSFETSMIATPSLFPLTGFVILDSKFKTFSRLFFQNNHLFLQNQGYQIGHQKRPSKKARTKLLLWCGANIRARLNKIWPKRNKFTYEALSVALDKKRKSFYHFSHSLSLFSRLFPGLENCWANFKTFSRIQDSVRTLHKIDRWNWYLLQNIQSTPVL